MATKEIGEAPHVLVTGAAGAIGGAVAQELRRRRPGARLSLVDRDVDGARRCARDVGGASHVFGADLGSESAVEEVVRVAVDAQGPIDGVVTCAGFMDVRRFESFPWARAAELLAVDLVSPLRLMHACVTAMVAEGRRGFVVNVASMAGRVPLLGCSFYGAAKAGLAMASEIARAELAPRGIHVVTVYPGPVASALERNARAQYETAWLARAIPTGSATSLARRIVDAVEQRRPRVIYPPLYALGYEASALAASFTLAFGPAPVA